MSAAAAIDAIAAELLAARDAGRQIPTFSSRPEGLEMDTALSVAERLHGMRAARGETPAGRKIGFTNRTIWPIYGVYAPIPGDIWAGGLFDVPGRAATAPLPALTEPRLEPEIVIGLDRAPEPGMDEAALMSCAGWIAHGFEIVFSPFPGWRFSAADSVAAFGLHAGLLVGPRRQAAEVTVTELSDFEITLSGGDGTTLKGRGRDVLDGPLSALKHLVDEIAATPGARPLAAGEIVSTGTLTDAVPLTRGQRWRTGLRGLALPGLDVTFT